MTVEAIKERIVSAGWSVHFVVHPSLVVEGHTWPVANVGVAKEELVGLLVVAFDGAADDVVDRYTGLGWSPESSARRVVAERGWLLKAQVHSPARARDELTPGLTESQLATADYGSWRALVERHGWVIDEVRSRETDFDAPQWQLRASRPGEHLSLDFTARAGRGSRALTPDGSGGMVLEAAPGPITARVVVRGPAVSLLDAIE